MREYTGFLVKFKAHVPPAPFPYAHSEVQLSALGLLTGGTLGGQYVGSG